MSDFETRARSAGRGLGGVEPVAVDPALPRRRLRRRRIAAATAAFVVVAGIGGGVAVARGNDNHTTVHVANNDATTTGAPTTTNAPTTEATATPCTTTVPGQVTTTNASATVYCSPSTVPEGVTTVPPSSNTTLPPASPLPNGLVGVVTVLNGNAVELSYGDPTTIVPGPGISDAYRMGDDVVVQHDVSVEVYTSGAVAHSIGDMTLVGVGTYHGAAVALVLDLHPDVLHDNGRFVSLYDLKTGTLIRTHMAIAPGTTLDRVSVAGDLFVLSGKSAEGGPFVVYEHADGSFDNSLPNVVAGNPSVGPVSNAVISPDGTRIAFLVGRRDLVVRDVRGGTEMEHLAAAEAGFSAVGLDFDGRWVVVSRKADAVLDQSDADSVAVDTQANPSMLQNLLHTAGMTTIVRP